jgi:hypothetical protein
MQVFQLPLIYYVNGRSKAQRQRTNILIASKLNKLNFSHIKRDSHCECFPRTLTIDDSSDEFILSPINR